MRGRTDRSWLPLGVTADGDRVLLEETRFAPFEFRARVFPPGGAPEPVTWGGSLVGPTALSGERVAFVGSARTGENAPLDHVYVIDRHSGAVEATAKLRRHEDAEGDDLALAPDGHAIVAVDGSLLTSRRASPRRRQAGRFSRPRFSGVELAQEAGAADRHPNANSATAISASPRSTCKASTTPKSSKRSTLAASR